MKNGCGDERVWSVSDLNHGFLTGKAHSSFSRLHVMVIISMARTVVTMTLRIDELGVWMVKPEVEVEETC